MADQEEYENGTVTLTLDNDEEIECAIISIFEAGEHDYIALLPLEGEDKDNKEVYLYRYYEDKNGEPSLENIEDDEEYEAAADAFDEMLDGEEFDEFSYEDEE